MADTPSPSETQGTSTRPYLLRALHEWCTDNGFTPYIAVFAGPKVQVPREYVKNNEIVLNVGFEATSGMKLGNEFIEFKARFGGVSREIRVPVDHVVAIYARENGQGMAFPVPAAADGGGGSNDAAPAQPATPRGLRLASTEPDNIAEQEALIPTGPTGPTEPPDPAGPAGPGASRPALKRIK